jgi:hypothetical protein
MKTFNTEKSKSGYASLARNIMVAWVVAITLIAAGPRALGDDNDSMMSVPPAVQVPDGNELKFHTYAIGVQIYMWTVDAAGSRWVFQAPEAVLFASEENKGVVGMHYAGPTWESNSGSKVVGARVAGVTVDPTAIPWLLLRAVTSQGPGVFNHVTFIQRLNTVGGLAPSTPGLMPGEIARVPYLAEYFFYEGED